MFRNYSFKCISLWYIWSLTEISNASMLITAVAFTGTARTRDHWSVRSCKYIKFI